MADEMDREDASGEGGKRRRRRRRRSRRGAAPMETSVGTLDAGRPRPRARAGREVGEPMISLANTGKVPRRRDPNHPYRGGVLSGTARRRRLGRAEIEALTAWVERVPEPLAAAMLKGLGGQPGRGQGSERVTQLLVRALVQGNRVGGALKSLHQRDRQALAVLVQAGGLAQAEELHQELVLSLGGTEKDWRRTMSNLSDRGMVAASEERDGVFFYIVPAPFIEPMIENLREDLDLPGFEHEGVRVENEVDFSPPLDFTITTLATYMDQHPPRLTQRQEIFKVHKDEMDKFFSQVWSPDSELFSFHIEFLMMHGMVELKGDRLVVNRSVVEEWIQLDPEDQRDLVFAALERRFPIAEWVLWAIHGVGGAWVAERRLQAVYRRWRRGEDWRERFHKGQWATPRSSAREAYSFSTLVSSGMLELGIWGQEKFYRLSPRARRLLEPSADEGFQKFYLTPSFEIMAPVGMAPLLFFRIGEFAELLACDRANTYKVTQVTVEQALERGWRRDDILEFLRENSQIGLPDNVEQTLRSWMGHHGDVEFHDVLLLTVHRSQIRRLETSRKLKPFLIHRFVPGMYAVDRSRMDELNEALAESGFAPTRSIRRYPDDPAAVDSRQRLIGMVTQAREDRVDLLDYAQMADSQPELLDLVPNPDGASKKKAQRQPELPSRRSPREVRELAERAIASGQALVMLYVARDQSRKLLKVAPERVATNARGEQVLVARDLQAGERLSYQILQIERLDILERA